MIRNTGTPCRRRLQALFVLGWLSLVVQPCLAAPLDLPAGMENCDHGGTAQHPAPCAEMQASDCIVAGDINLDSLRAADPPRHGILLTVLPPPRLCPATVTDSTTAPGAERATGPPLIILFGHLRN